MKLTFHFNYILISNLWHLKLPLLDNYRSYYNSSKNCIEQRVINCYDHRILKKFLTKRRHIITFFSKQSYYIINKFMVMIDETLVTFFLTLGNYY